MSHEVSTTLADPLFADATLCAEHRFGPGQHMAEYVRAAIVQLTRRDIAAMQKGKNPKEGSK